jgi:hypothetical protein
VANQRATLRTRSPRADLQRLAALTARQTRAVAETADVTAIAQWWRGGADKRVERIVIAGPRTAVALGSRYLREHAALSGATVDPVAARLDLDAARASLFVVAVGGFLDHLRANGRGSEQSARRVMTNQLVGSVTRLALAGDRDTALATFRAGQ